MITAAHGLASSAESTIRRLTGLTFPASRRDILERGLALGMSRSGASDLSTYLDRLAAEPAVLDDLVGEITVGETYFFRDPRQFATVRDAVLMPRLQNPTSRRLLRIWSAGCASGEEPYSLAMLLHALGRSDAAEIMGTDIARQALTRAQRACYRQWALRATPPETAARYFHASGERFTLVSEIRRVVEFRYLNLAADTYPSFAAGIWGMDLILCRNVLIYFDTETVQRVATRLLECLGPEGWLVTGASDPPLGDLVACEVVVMDAGLAYRRAGRRNELHIHPAFAPAPMIEPVASVAPPARPPTEVAAAREPAPQRAVTLEDAVQAYAVHDYAAAAAAAHHLTQSADADPLAWVILVRALANAGDLAVAGRVCAAALDQHRMCAELAYLHGVLLTEGGRHAEAVAAFQGALYLDRHMVVAHLAQAGALARLGDRKGARRALRNAARVLDQLPGDRPVPASDDALAGRLAEQTRVHLTLLAQEPA